MAGSAPTGSPGPDHAALRRPRRAGFQPEASREAIAARIEGWRRSFESKDLSAYLGFYASSFGAQGRDLAGWAELRSRAFSSALPFTVKIDELQVDARDAIVIVSFRQSWRSGSREERGVKRLYLLAEDGAWRIFNEEWMPGEQ
jgi:ketosteroid isomerase-like protein